jgi:hypothetical protein
LEADKWRQKEKPSKRLKASKAFIDQKTALPCAGRLLDCGSNLVGKGLHFGRFHLHVMAEIEVARSVEGHQVDVRVRHVDADDGDANLDAGAHLFEALGNGAAETVQLDKQVVIEVENVVDFLLGNAQHVAADDGVDIEECQTVVGFGHFIARYFTGDDA